jgi:hypothetical protein
MITDSQFRSVAIVLKDRVDALYLAVFAVHDLVKDWVLNASDFALPLRAEVKTAYELYKHLSISPIEIRDFLRELQTSTDFIPDGISFPESGIIFSLEGITL